MPWTIFKNCTNNGNITLTNSNSTYTEITGLFLESYKNITGCVNKGNIEVSDNTIIGIEIVLIIQLLMFLG